MQLSAKIRMRNGNEVDGIVTTDHSASSYGMPVVLIGNQVIDPIAGAAVTIHDRKAQAQEVNRAMAALRQAGYGPVFATDFAG